MASDVPRLPTGEMLRTQRADAIRVLLVDDDSGLLQVTKEILHMAGGIEVFTASYVDEAFKKITQEEYDIVVSDYQMPVKDGLQFLKELREQKIEIPFILFTGKGREEVAISALNLGADGYFNKQGDTETVYGELSHGIRLAVERRRVTIALEESEKRYRSLMEQAAEAIFIHDKTGRLLDANMHACKNLGYAKEELLSMHISDIDPEATVDKKGAAWPAVLAGQTVTFEGINRRKNGSTFPVEVTLSSMPLGKEDVVIGLARDITERKKAEEALEKEQKDLDCIVDSSPIIIFYKDNEGKFLRVNKAFAEALKVPKEEFVGKTVFDFYSAEIAQSMANDDSEVLKSGHPKLGIIERYESARGIRWVRTDKVPIFDNNGTPTGLVGFAQDITEQKMAEEALKESEEKYRELINGMNDTAWVIDLDANFVDVNDAAVKVLGYSREELHSMGPADIDSSLSKEQIKDLVKRMPVDQAQVFETSHTTKDGRRIPVEISSSLVTYKGKQAILSIARNITERKKIEQELEEKRIQLEIMNEKLHVVGGLTRHDVRNKLATIEGNIHLATKKIPPENNAMDYLTRIDSTVSQITKIFNFASAYERIGFEKLSYIDVEKAFEEALSYFPDLQNVTVTADCHGLAVLADSLLSQVFYNLIDNSLKHGITTSQIRIRCQQSGKETLRIIYEDNGVGISDVEKPNLFSEGYSTAGSTGYGLYLLRRAIEFYGWSIKETGEPCKGARFIITIPKKRRDNVESYILPNVQKKKSNPKEREK